MFRLLEEYSFLQIINGLRGMRRMRSIVSISTIFLLTTSISSNAAEENQNGELIIISELSRSEVSSLIVEAEDQLYEFFNANNQNNMNDIYCAKVKSTGSNISKRVCEPKFLVNARTNNRTDLQDSFALSEPQWAVNGSLKEEYKELQSEMEKLSENNQQFREISVIVTQLNARKKELDKK